MMEMRDRGSGRKTRSESRARNPAHRKAIRARVGFGRLGRYDIDQSGAAAEAGIARGDVILEINRKPVNSVDDVKSALEGTSDRPVLILVNRRGQTVFLTVRPSRSNHTEDERPPLSGLLSYFVVSAIPSTMWTKIYLTSLIVCIVVVGSISFYGAQWLQSVGNR